MTYFYFLHSINVCVISKSAENRNFKALLRIWVGKVLTNRKSSLHNCITACEHEYVPR